MNKQLKILLFFIAIVMLLSACNKNSALLSEQDALSLPMKAMQDVDVLCKVNAEIARIAALSFIQNSEAFVDGKTIKKTVPVTDSLGNKS